ncbi:MAG: hypothetical protein ABIQ49_04860 [Gemmatimonadales bacterium]
MAQPKETRGDQQVLLIQEQHSHTLAEAIPQLAWIAESGGSIFWHNRRWYDYTGTTPGAPFLQKPFTPGAGAGWSATSGGRMAPRRWREPVGAARAIWRRRARTR